MYDTGSFFERRSDPLPTDTKLGQGSMPLLLPMVLCRREDAVRKRTSVFQINIFVGQRVFQIPSTSFEDQTNVTFLDMIPAGSRQGYGLEYTLFRPKLHDLYGSLLGMSPITPVYVSGNWRSFGDYAL